MRGNIHEDFTIVFIGTTVGGGVGLITPAILLSGTAYRYSLISRILPTGSFLTKAVVKGVILVTGANERSDVYTVQIDLAAKSVTAFRLEVLPDKSLPKSGPGRAENGNFVLTGFRATRTVASAGGDVVEAPQTHCVGGRGLCAESDRGTFDPLRGVGADIEDAKHPRGRWLR